MHETDHYHQFFERFGLDGLDPAGYGATLAGQEMLPGQWDDWSQPELPIFHGSTASLQPPTLHSAVAALDDAGRMFDLGAAGHDAAAAMLSPSMMPDHGHGGFPQHYRDPPPDPFAPLPPPPMRHQPLAYGGQGVYGRADPPPPPSAPALGRDPSAAIDRAFFDQYPQLRGLFYDPPDRPPRSRAAANTEDYPRFGSDANFQQQRYEPPPDQKQPEEVVDGLVRLVETLEPQRSAGNTQPPSPVLQKSHRRLGGADGLPAEAPPAADGHARATDHPAARRPRAAKPKRRRKDASPPDSPDGDGAEPDDHDPGGGGGDGQAEGGDRPTIKKSRSNGRAAVAAAAAPARRARAGRSPGGKGKAPRQNLTDDQKRNNHILSEQKRRDLIKQGFEQMYVLIPATKAAGTSRSQQLNVCAEWLERLASGNLRLRLQLARLGGSIG